LEHDFQPDGAKQSMNQVGDGHHQAAAIFADKMATSLAATFADKLASPLDSGPLGEDKFKPVAGKLL
jgi:hypothetical protein